MNIEIYEMMKKYESMKIMKSGKHCKNTKSQDE